MSTTVIFILGELVGIFFGALFMALWKSYLNRNYLYTSKDVRDAYHQGLRDGEESRIEGIVNRYTEVSH